MPTDRRVPTARADTDLGGEPFGRMLSTRLQRLMPDVRVVDIYGLTETCSSDFFLTAEEREAFAETIGRPGPGRSLSHRRRSRPRVAGERRRRIADLCMPFAMSGYLDDPDQTRAAFADGYFCTGDLALWGARTAASNSPGGSRI